MTATEIIEKYEIPKEFWDAILALYAELVDKVIGVDEPKLDGQATVDLTGNLFIEDRNKLRAEQRQRLDKLMNGEESA